MARMPNILNCSKPKPNDVPTIPNTMQYTIPNKNFSTTMLEKYCGSSVLSCAILRLLKFAIPISRMMLKIIDRLYIAAYTPQISVPTTFCTVRSMPKMQNGLTKMFRKSNRIRFVIKVFLKMNQFSTHKSTFFWSRIRICFEIFRGEIC